MSVYTRELSGILDQGDILSPMRIDRLASWWPNNNELPLVVMTPTCDVNQKQADHHRLCVLQPLPFMFYKLCKDAKLSKEEFEGGSPISKTKHQRIDTKLKSIIKNGQYRYHYFPKEEGVFETDYFIDFEIVLTVPIGELSEENRYARINSPYKEELIHRYSHHVMRIGTEDLESGEIETIVSNCFQIANIQVPA